MGYRSYGNLVFPAKYLPRFAETVYPDKEPNFGEWDDKDAWRNRQGIDMIRLSYSGWKWYESYPDIQRIEQFMSDLEELSDEQLDYADKIFWPSEEIPDSVVLKNITPPKAINQFKISEVGFQAVMWKWGYNRQGEETEDYTQYGDSDNLSHESEIDWGYFTEYVSGEDNQGWIYAMEVTPAEKAILEAVKPESYPYSQYHPHRGNRANQDIFETDRYDYKNQKSYQTNYCVLYGNLPMPNLNDLQKYFIKHLGRSAVDKKENDERYVWAEASWNDDSQTYYLQGNNYWEWEVYNNSYPAFWKEGNELDFDQVLQSYMKVAKEE